jgi:hypothetical protein
VLSEWLLAGLWSNNLPVSGEPPRANDENSFWRIPSSTFEIRFWNELYHPKASE